ncbi:phosphate propanoyltransferase [Helicovermis profundi]|uniref:Phosphate propanoyltransferase n=1 Tax=Helicovermis profundi TaxID=3065157 RepID=A0AAU9EJ44_9FIRM|nr:phosphate propanoyltransferase [Clostridia bacterium S502]
MIKKLVPVGLSNRHVHLSQAHIDVLFGKGYELTKFKDLSQPGQFACNEKIDVVGRKGKLTMRVLGPARGNSQIEISVTDGFALGVNPPVRDSGNLADSPGGKLVGPKGEVEITEGIIAAARHIHMHTADAEKYNVKDKEYVSVRVTGERGLVFENVLCRVSPSYALEFHLDIDEGNASGLKNGVEVEII